MSAIPKFHPYCSTEYSASACGWIQKASPLLLCSPPPSLLSSHTCSQPRACWRFHWRSGQSPVATVWHCWRTPTREEKTRLSTRPPVEQTALLTWWEKGLRSNWKLLWRFDLYFRSSALAAPHGTYIVHSTLCCSSHSLMLTFERC